MINESIYQEIFDLVSGLLPEKWERLVVYLEYGAASYSMEFYVKTGTNYIKCYDLPDINEEELYNTFDAVDEMVVEERNKETGKLWTNMTMCIDDNGKMHTDFDYTDLSENSYEYSKSWKKKYLV